MSVCCCLVSCHSVLGYISVGNWLVVPTHGEHMVHSGRPTETHSPQVAVGVDGGKMKAETREVYSFSCCMLSESFQDLGTTLCN
jgi:hypothetical protein